MGFIIGTARDQGSPLPPSIEDYVAPDALVRVVDIFIATSASIPPEEAEAHFGWLGMFASSDLTVSSTITRKKLGWSPNGPGLISDLKNLTLA